MKADIVEAEENTNQTQPQKEQSNKEQNIKEEEQINHFTQKYRTHLERNIIEWEHSNPTRLIMQKKSVPQTHKSKYRYGQQKART